MRELESVSAARFLLVAAQILYACLLVVAGLGGGLEPLAVLPTFFKSPLSLPLPAFIVFLIYTFFVALMIRARSLWLVFGFTTLFSSTVALLAYWGSLIETLISGAGVFSGVLMLLIGLGTKWLKTDQRPFSSLSTLLNLPIKSKKKVSFRKVPVGQRIIVFLGALFTPYLNKACPMKEFKPPFQPDRIRNTRSFNNVGKGGLSLGNR